MTTNTFVDELIHKLGLWQLEAAHIRNASSRHHANVITVNSDFCIGQRVIITNAVMINNQHPSATVTRLTPI